MIRIDVLCVGKIKEAYYTAAVGEYVKRLGRYCKPSIQEVADEATLEGASPAQMQSILSTEGERILKRIPAQAWVIALDIKGKKYDSPGLSAHLDQLSLLGKSHLVFVIGGSLGLSSEVLGRANERISFSDLTFPHQLMRVILLEQLYRSFRISRGEPYHK